MAENVQITPGTGVTIGADSVTDGTLGSAQIQYIKIMDGTIGGTNKAAVTANGLAIDGSGVTQPISAISLPLPTGAATSSNQSSEISLLTTIASNTTNASTPTVSGTVTVLQPTAANLNATVTQTTAADLVTESWLNDGSGNAISSTSGSLDVQVSNFPATQTVAGTVIANAGTGTFQTNVTNASIPVTESGIWNITNITGSISLPTGAATEATLLDVKSDLDQFTFSANGLLVDGSGVTQPVSGTITAQQSVAANLLATVYLNDGSGNPISSTTGSLNVNVTNASGLDTVNQGNPNTLANAWPVELSDGTNLLGTGAHPVRIDPTGTTTQPISGTVSVSNFPATQPVSGTVTANQGTSPWVISGTVTVGNASVAVTQSGVWSIGRTWTLASGTDSVSSVQSGTWNLNNISGTISLPTGAATSAKQPALGTAGSASTDVITVQGIVGMTALKVDGSGVTQPISGTVTANAGTGTFTVGQTTGTNLHTVVDSGSIAVTQSTSPWVVSLASTTITGTVTAVGNLTHNNAAPATNNIGVLPAVASSSTPTYNAGDQVLLSTDLSGNLRVIIDGTVSEQNVNLNQVGGSSISIGQATMAASLPVVLASNQSSIPVTLTSTTITGTVAVTQSGTWNIGTLTNITNPVAVTGTFWQATQPVSGTVTANQGGAPWAENITQIAGSVIATAATGIAKVGLTDGSGTSVTVGQKVMASSLPVTIASDQSSITTTYGKAGATKSMVWETGSLVTTATTSNQVVLTYTVTAGKTLNLNYVQMSGYQTTVSGNSNPIHLGTIQLETPSATAVIVLDISTQGGIAAVPGVFTFPEPMQIAAGTVIRVTTTPAATTSFTWRANFGGYEA